MKPKAGAPAPLEMTPLLRTEAVAELLGQSPKTIRNRLGRGILGFPAIKIGGSVRFAREDVIKFIARCRDGAA